MSQQAASMSRERAALFKRVDQDMSEKLTTILKDLMARPSAVHFKLPVVMNGYDDMIKQRMDLSTVRLNLENDLRVEYGKKTYEQAEEFAHDVRLVFKNCFLFNRVEHHVFKYGRTLCKSFEDRYGEVVQQAEVDGPRVPLRTRCQLLLTDLRRHPFSEWFRRDDWKALGASYREIIKEPMDLDEVQRRLDSGVYGGNTVFDVDKFAADVRLIWRNGLEFNRDGTMLGVMLTMLQVTSQFASPFSHVWPVLQLRPALCARAHADALGAPRPTCASPHLRLAPRHRRATSSDDSDTPWRRHGPHLPHLTQARTRRSGARCESGVASFTPRAVGFAPLRRPRLRKPLRRCALPRCDADPDATAAARSLRS